MNEVGVDRAPTPIAEDPRRLPPQREARHLLELGEVGVGPIVVGLGKNEVVADQLCNVGDRAGHD